MTVVDELAGVRWRRGLACRLPRLWLDTPRAGALGLLTDADLAVPARARVLATPIAATLAALTAGRALQVPYGQPFQLGAGAVELLPSGASLGGAIARLHGKGQTILAVRSAVLEPLPSCAPLELREADVLLVNAAFADAPTCTPADLRAHLHAALAEPARIWLLQDPLLALDLLLWSDSALRIAPALLRLVQRSGLRLLAPQSPGRQPRGLLLWPLSQAARVPAGWHDAPRTVIGEPHQPLLLGADRVPFSRRLAGDALDTLVQRAACPTVLAWGDGAQALAERLERRGQLCHALRIPYQLSLV